MEQRTAPDDARPTRPPALRRRRTLIVLLAAALLAGAAVTAVVLKSRNAPAETVERYLAALLERDVAAALDEVDPDSMPEGERTSVFLDEAAMRTDWSFGSIDLGPLEDHSGQDRRVVTAELSGFGQTGEAVFEVAETDDGWRITNPFARVSFAFSSLTYLDVDGVRAVDPQPEVIDPRPVYPVFPGGHRFFESLPEGVELSSPDDYDLLLLPAGPDGEDEPVAPVPGMTLGGELADQAQQQIRQVIDVCAESTETDPFFHDAHDVVDFTRYCPFTAAGRESLEDGRIVYPEAPVEWTVTEYPVFEVVDPPKEPSANQALFGGFQALVAEPGTISAVMPVDVYEGGGAEPQRFTAAIECEFEPDGFRSRLDEDDALSMYFLGVFGESSGATVVGLTADGCTHSLEER